MCVSANIHGVHVFKCLREVPALNEVSGHIPSRSAVNHRGDVMPRHSGSGVSVDEVCAEWKQSGVFFKNKGGRKHEKGDGERTSKGEKIQWDSVERKDNGRENGPEG